jgi:hypothetical protein
VLRHGAVLWADTDVSEEHTASIFGIEVYGFRNRLKFIGTFHGRFSWNPRKEDKETNIDTSEWIKMDKERRENNPYK